MTAPIEKRTPYTAALPVTPCRGLARGVAAASEMGGGTKEGMGGGGGGAGVENGAAKAVRAGVTCVGRAGAGAAIEMECVNPKEKNKESHAVLERP
jgi:hypothetical protein